VHPHCFDRAKRRQSRGGWMPDSYSWRHWLSQCREGYPILDADRSAPPRL
jgi:hypothetical protein